MPDRDDYVREFQKAATDFVSTQIAFTNAAIAHHRLATDWWSEILPTGGLPCSTLGRNVVSNALHAPRRE